MADMIAGNPEAEPAPLTITVEAAGPASSLAADAVKAKLASAYATNLGLCYTHSHARDALAFSLRVDEAGRASTPDTTDSELWRCVSGNVKAWRFPIPKDGAHTPTTATFKVRIERRSPAPTSASSCRTSSATDT